MFRWIASLLLCSIPVLAAYPNGYNYRRAITIDYTKLTGTVTDFPVVVNGTYSYLATTANGGLVTNSSGFDIVFTASDGTTSLSCEQESYSATTGAVVYWVKVPSVSHTVNTTIYIYYGNSSISTSQCTASAVWGSNWKGVWHLPNGSTLTANDSTSNANNGTFSSPTATTGQMDGGAAYTAVGGITVTNSASINISGTNVLSLSAWVKRAATNTTGIILNKEQGGTGGYSFSIGVSPATTNQIKLTKYGVVDITIGTFPADTNWHHLVAVFSGTGVVVYIDGVSNATSGNSSNFNATTNPLQIGGISSSVWNGSIDEARVSNTALSADWVKAEYNNQSSPSTFYSVGSQEASALRRPPVVIQ